MTARTARSQPWRRPEYVTGYEQEIRLLNTLSKRLWVGVLLLVAVLLPFAVEDNLLRLLATGFVAAIGAVGLTIVTGCAGQVSLGHAFFLALGAYTAAAVSGDPDGRTIGFGITFLPVWLMAGGLVAALAGFVVAPLATRLRGLYLAVVTLGLVVIGEHVFTEWRALTGGAGIGRPAAVPELFGADLRESGAVLTGDQKMYLLMLVLLVVFGVAARNVIRSKIGRAFAAVRDSEVAAMVIGVNLRRYTLLAFTLSSFYAGCAGALLYTVTGFFTPGSFNLLMSVQYIAMILIGGVATVSGAVMGALFVSMLPWVTRELSTLVPLISSSPTAPLNVFQVETVLYGLIIIAFLIFEPRGLFGIWLRVRNYWKSWPFSY